MWACRAWGGSAVTVHRTEDQVWTRRGWVGTDLGAQALPRQKGRSRECGESRPRLPVQRRGQKGACVTSLSLSRVLVLGGMGAGRGGGGACALPPSPCPRPNVAQRPRAGPGLWRRLRPLLPQMAGSGRRAVRELLRKARVGRVCAGNVVAAPGESYLLFIACSLAAPRGPSSRMKREGKG